jgi:hypothetical protein
MREEESTQKVKALENELVLLKDRLNDLKAER